jgi:hypothetical protein
MHNLIDIGNGIIIAPQQIQSIVIEDVNPNIIITYITGNRIITKCENYETALARFNEIKTKLGIK